MDNFLTALVNWFHKHRVQLNQKGVDFTFSEMVPSSNKPSQFVDIRTPQFLARITIWSSGECDGEAININSGETAAYLHDEFDSISEMEKALPNYITKLTKQKIK